MYEGPEFRHLRYFIAVAEQCSFGKAARLLHVSQPALSTQIKQLEDGMNAVLFIRGRAGASLTAAGRTLLPRAREMLALRRKAMEHTSLAHVGGNLPFRFGYSAWVDQTLVHESIVGYRELVPDGLIEPSSQTTGPLADRVAEGELDAALVNLPLNNEALYIQQICLEKLMICLRVDDPYAHAEALTREIVADRLRIMFNRDLHPLLFDEIERKFARAGIQLRPTDFVAHPSDMQFLIKEGVGFGLVREMASVDPELTKRLIPGVNLVLKTVFICPVSQQRPVLPLLAYRVAEACAQRISVEGKKKPVASATAADFHRLDKTA